MALTTQQKKRAAKWWFTQVFKKANLPAHADWNDLSTALDEADAWADAVPVTGPASNGVAFAQAINSMFKTKLTTAGVTLSTALAYLLAAMAQARAGAFG